MEVQGVGGNWSCIICKFQLLCMQNSKWRIGTLKRTKSWACNPLLLCNSYCFMYFNKFAKLKKWMFIATSCSMTCINRAWIFKCKQRST